MAEHRNKAAKRTTDLEGAQADFSKAQSEMRKGPILSDIDRQKNQIKLDDGREHVAVLPGRTSITNRRKRRKAGSSSFKDTGRRWQWNAPRPTCGSWSCGLRPGSPLLRLFNPQEMEVVVGIEEPDVAALKARTDAIVHLDAFPETRFTARFESASPIATSALESPMKTFTARFRLSQSDPHLLPDLSAAVDIRLPAGAAK